MRKLNILVQSPRFVPAGIKGLSPAFQQPLRLQENGFCGGQFTVKLAQTNTCLV